MYGQTIRRTHIREVNGKKTIVHRHPMKFRKSEIRDEKLKYLLKSHEVRQMKKPYIHKEYVYPLDDKELNYKLSYFTNAYGRDNVKLEWMDPKKFLVRTPHPLSEYLTAYDAANDPEEEKIAFSKSSIDYITNSYKNMEPMSPLFYYEGLRQGAGYEHEGRHRAYVAWKMGIKSVPVIVINHRRFSMYGSYNGKKMMGKDLIKSPSGQYVTGTYGKTMFIGGKQYEPEDIERMMKERGL